MKGPNLLFTSIIQEFLQNSNTFLSCCLCLFYTRNKIVSNLCQFPFFEMQSRQKYFRMWKYIKLDLSDFKTGSIDLILRGIDFYVSNGDLLESSINSIWVKMPQKYRLEVISASVSWFSFFPVLIFIRSGKLSLFTHKKIFGTFSEHYN